MATFQFDQVGNREVTFLARVERKAHHLSPSKPLFLFPNQYVRIFQHEFLHGKRHHAGSAHAAGRLRVNALLGKGI